MLLDIDKRVALVTGSSRGIGRSTARIFAREGANVVVTYHEERAAAEALAEEIRAEGADALAVAFCLESETSIRAAVEAILAKWGRIDILVNNAFNTGTRQRLSKGNAAPDWQILLRTNIEGSYLAIQEVLPAMRANRWGRIVNVSSALAVDGLAGFTWYTTAKAALHGMTRSLSRELGPSGILVNTVMPGLTDTVEQPLYLSKLHVQKAASVLPLRRLPTPDEVARVIVFLCSSANAVVTGEIIRVSGGW